MMFKRIGAVALVAVGAAGVPLGEPLLMVFFFYGLVLLWDTRRRSE